MKLGSALLFCPSNSGVDHGVLRSIASQISELRRQGVTVILVSSGAIALGAQTMNLDRSPEKMSERQALAAIGQSLLMSSWRAAFAEEQLEVAQVLLTHDDLGNRKRYLNASHAIESMLKMGVIPIVNENDTVSVEEIRLGDNDRLSSQVAVLTNSEALFILSTVSGLFDQNPVEHREAKRIPIVDEVTEEIERAAHMGKSLWGSGGMGTKIESARSASLYGIPTVIANGREKEVIFRLRRGEDLGTLFLPKARILKGRKHWIAFTLKTAGTLRIDEGARKALVEDGKSLLPSGLLSLEGSFHRGDAVVVQGPNGEEVGRGLIAYESEELQKILGLKTNQVHKALGYKGSDEVIHRDDLVIENHR